MKAGSIGRSLTAPAMGLMFLLVFLVHLAQVPSVHPWWSDTHQFIASNAIDLLPDSLDWFFENYRSTIVGYSSVEWEPKYSHWYHVDVGLPYPDSTEGALPWFVENYFDMFVQYLEEGNWGGAAEFAGKISHLIGDGSNPLHATSDFNPGGNHLAFEGEVDKHLGEINMDMLGFEPQELGNFFDSTMEFLEVSYSYTSVLNPYLRSGILWNDEIKNLTEERLRASAQLHANIWYTGMAQAGLVVPTSSVDSITPYWRTSTPFTITATASTVVQSAWLYYRYSTDDSSWGGWTRFGYDGLQPYSWSFTAPQGDGYYEFYSIAIDGAGNVESPPAAADARCGVDRAAPASSVNTISPYWRTSVPFDITATVSDATSGVENVSLYYRYSTDNSSWGSWTLFGTDTVSPWSWSFNAPPGYGYYQFYSIAKDYVNNVESAPGSAHAICGVDRIAPYSSVNSISRTSVPFDITATASDAMSGVENISLYNRYSPDNSSWSTWALYGTDAAAPWEWSFIAPSGSGYYEFYSIAVDRAGNVEQAPTEADARCRVETIVRGVEATISPAEKTGLPGENLTFTVTVKNTGEAEDSYDLTVSDNAGWEAWLDENLLTILTGENTMVTVSVTVPSDAVDGDSTMISVTATSRGDPTKSDSATCTATAGEEQPGPPILPIAVGGTVVGGGAAVAILVKKGIIHLPSMSSHLRSD